MKVRSCAGVEPVRSPETSPMRGACAWRARGKMVMTWTIRAAHTDKHSREAAECPCGRKAISKSTHDRALRPLMHSNTRVHTRISATEACQSNTGTEGPQSRLETDPGPPRTLSRVRHLGQGPARHHPQITAGLGSAGGLSSRGLDDTRCLSRRT